jgi:hypothetical protein
MMLKSNTLFKIGGRSNVATKKGSFFTLRRDDGFGTGKFRLHVQT